MNNSHEVPRWTELKVFTVSIASQTDQLFANGRQQVHLRIAVEGLDINGESVKLSKGEIDSLKLVQYQGVHSIPFSRSERVTPLRSNDAWDWSYERNYNYKYHPSVSRPTVNDHGFGSSNRFVTYIDTYVRCIADSQLRIAACITRSDGEEFYSADRSNGSVTVFPVPVPRYRAQDYVFNAVDVQRNNRYQIDYIAFALHSGGENVEFRDFSMSPASVLQEAGSFRRAPYDRKAQVKSIAFTGYTKPGQPAITYAAGVPDSQPTYIDGSFIRPGRPVVVAIRTWTRRSNLPGRTRSSKIFAVDMYGNSHDVNVRLVQPGGQFQQLELLD
jgi:hypothetical protein